ncbi:MAG: 4Fe-4S binding protein [Deltaproteobacteria bacterium]|nr:4Fe-4S binding protein [Deltaproteobacteria bacterium]
MPEKNAYSRFIQHLGSRILGLPDSEDLVRLVEATLTPEEAEFLSDFPFQPHTIEQLAEKCNQSVDELQPRLDSLAERGIINRYYYDGMGREFGAYPTMSLRAIPIQRTIEDTRQILPYEDVAEFVQGEDYICVGHCPCRQMKNIDPDAPSCDHETLNCLHFGTLARYMVKQGMGKRISQEETMEILRDAADAGLVHAISNAKTDLDSICNCCSCCCVFLQSANVLGLSGHQQSNYILQINQETCKGCGLCVERCPMETLRLEDSAEANNKVGKFAVLDPDRCIGCGVCVHKCPSDSLRLVHRKEEQDFPDDFCERIERQARERGKNLYA